MAEETLDEAYTRACARLQKEIAEQKAAEAAVREEFRERRAAREG